MSERTILIVALCTGVVLACALSGIVGYQIAPKAKEAVQAPGRTISIPIDGKMVDLPSDQEVIIETDSLEEAFNIARSVTEAAASKGAGVEETGSALKATWDQRAAEASTSTARGSGGGLKATWEAMSRISVTSILAAIGALAIIGGIALCFTGNLWLGVGVAVGGLACAFSAFLWEEHPWVVAVLVILAIAAVIYMVVRAKQGKTIKQALADDAAALKAIVAGVDNAPPEAKEPVLAEIKKAGTATGKLATVKAVVAKTQGA